MTMNRHDSLISLLTSLLNQTFQNWDLTILENDSEGNNLADNIVIRSLLVELHRQGHIIKIGKGIEEKGQWGGLSLTFQRYIDITPYEINVHCHDHNVLFPDSIEKLIEPHFKLDNVGMTGGIIYRVGTNIVHKEKNYFKYLDEGEKVTAGLDVDFILHWFTIQNTEWGDETPDFIGAETLNGGFVSFKKGAIDASGGAVIKEGDVYSVHEDTDMSLRVKLAGYENIICTGARHMEYDVTKLKGSFYADDMCGVDPYKKEMFQRGHALSYKRFRNLYKQDKKLMMGRKINLAMVR